MAGEHAHIPIDDDILLRDEDSTYGDSDVASETTSLKSAISNYYYQHGRRYHAYHAGSYWGPNDAQSADQMDIGHHVFTLVLDGKLFLSPLGDHPQKILDIGTGTGIWAIDIADQFPSAQVIGTDLSPIQPREVPPNLQFEIDDCCSEWTYTKNSFDFIHARSMYGSVSDWSAFYKQVYDHLKPGGWFEQFEMGVELKSDDGTVTEDSIFGQWGRVSLAAGDAFGKSLRTVDESKPGMIAAGLENVVERRYKLPVGGWSSDPMLKELGLYYRLYWEEGIELWSMYLLTNYLHWRKEEVEVYLARMRQMLRDKTVHAYVDATCVYGQKPMKYDSSFTDTSSYQSYETSTTSSDLAGEKEKKIDESMDNRSHESNHEQHTKMSDVTNGIAVAGIATSNTMKPKAEREPPKQAYVEPDMNDNIQPDSIMKTSIGSPAGDSTYASPRANTASPLGNHGVADAQTQESMVVGQTSNGGSAPQTNEKDGFVGAPRLTEDGKMIGTMGQHTNIDPEATTENVPPTNSMRVKPDNDKTHLSGESMDKKSSGVLETDGNYDKRASSNFMNLETGNLPVDETHASPTVAEKTFVPDRISTDTVQPGTTDDDASQPVAVPVQAPVPDQIPALAQTPISLPNQVKPLDFAGNPENDKGITKPQVAPGQANQPNGGNAQPVSNQTLAQPPHDVNEAMGSMNDAFQPKLGQESSYNRGSQQNLSIKDVTFESGEQDTNNASSLQNRAFDATDSAKNTSATTMGGGYVIEESVAKPDDKIEPDQEAFSGNRK